MDGVGALKLLESCPKGGARSTTKGSRRSSREKYSPRHGVRDRQPAYHVVSVVAREIQKSVLKGEVRSLSGRECHRQTGLGGYCGVMDTDDCEVPTSTSLKKWRAAFKEKKEGRPHTYPTRILGKKKAKADPLSHVGRILR